MAPKFIFEVPSDEEEPCASPRHPLSEEPESEVEDGEDVQANKRNAQSPWDFGSYAESIVEEHIRRGTTSIDHKISKALQQRLHPLPEYDGDNRPPPDYGRTEIHEDDDFFEEDDAEGNENATETVGSKNDNSFFASSEGVSFHADSFIELNLSRPLLRACETLGYSKPTPIQAACIPLALSGRDICGSAITGSGKTAAFALPTLERLLYRPKKVQAIRVLILTPTRELAVQVHSMIEKLAQFTDIRCCLIVGGLSTKVQEVALRSMPDIVVATPGRMIDHMRNSISVDMNDLAVLILDEADRLLELGFSAEIHELVQLCPKRRQTMLFSATLTEQVDELIKLSLSKPVRLSADPSAKRPSTLTEEVVRIRRLREANQEAVLLALCSKTFTSKVIIFSGTKQAAHRLKILFGLAGLKAAELHGNLTQVQRLEALELFRKQEADFLIATDVAARGLDIIGVKTVINYACPRELTSYVHRVGRTARAGREGYAVTFVTDNDRSLLKSIAKRAGSKLKSRIVAEQSISKWTETIEQMEEQVTAIVQEEREERALRKAEMLAEKAENMIKYKEEIFARPKRTWFASEREKMLIAKGAKEFLQNASSSERSIVSAQEAERLKLKEKRKLENEKHLPRKMRRKLQAARELLDGDESEDRRESEDKKKKFGMSLVDLGYRRAKAAKASSKARDTATSGGRKSLRSRDRTQSRANEMQDLFQNDMKVKRRKSNTGNMKPKSSFKSKSRYKRR